MQIKRFEAADMTEALRMVKREFGDEAVILSAREVRPRGFFSALKKKHVEITAATDYPTEDATPEDEFTGLLAQQLDEIASTDRVSLSTPKPVASLSTRRPSRFRSLTAHDEKALKGSDNHGASKEREAVRTTHSPAMAATQRQGPRLPAKENGHLRGNQTENNPGHRYTQPFYACRNHRSIVALVGPSGAGKSTAAAKLAWHCRVSRKQKVGLISLDRFRMAANSLLERFAQIVGLPFYVVHNTDQLQAALSALSAVDTVLIDTPGS